MQKLRTISFGKWLLVSLVTYALLDAAFVGLFGLALSLPFRSLLLPYMLFLYCGLVLTILLYWARESYERPRSCAIRLAFTIFSYLLLFMSALLISAVREGIVLQSTALNHYAPYLLPASLVAAIQVYAMAFKRLQSLHEGDQLANTQNERRS